MHRLRERGASPLPLYAFGCRVYLSGPVSRDSFVFLVGYHVYHLRGPSVKGKQMRAPPTGTDSITATVTFPMRPPKRLAGGSGRTRCSVAGPSKYSCRCALNEEDSAICRGGVLRCNMEPVVLTSVRCTVGRDTTGIAVFPYADQPRENVRRGTLVR